MSKNNERDGLNKGIAITLMFIMLFGITLTANANSSAPEPISSNKIGTYDGFDYEYWSQNQNDGTMWLTGGGTYHCDWDAHNILFRTGKKLGSVMSYNEYGDIVIDYEGFYNLERGDVSYLTVYGWTQEPLMEWYIVEDRGSYRPGRELAGTIEVDGALYDVYTDTRVEQPSIEGTKTFPQIYSIRKEGRSSGVITVSDHFKAWAELGLDVSGGLYEVTMCLEGFNSKGNGAITKFILTLGDDVFGSENDYLGAPDIIPPELDVEPESTPKPIPDISTDDVLPTEDSTPPAEEPVAQTPQPSNDNDLNMAGIVIIGITVGIAVGVAVYFTQKKQKEKRK